MLFAFLLSFFGITIAIRIATRLMALNFFNRSEMTKIGTAYVLSVLVLARIFPTSYLGLWLAIFAPFCAFALGISLLLSSRAKRFRREMREVLGLISLKMRAGKSYRQSFSEVAHESLPRVRASLNELQNVVVFSQQTTVSDPFLAELISELTLIDRNSHAATRRLQTFREKLRVEDDFRRKGGQVLARIRAQSLIMTGLYVAMFAFMAWKFGWRSNVKLMIISALLFLGGTLWLWLGGRRIKWKV